MGSSEPGQPRCSLSFRYRKLTNNNCHLEGTGDKRLLRHFLLPFEGDLFYLLCLSWLRLGLRPVSSAQNASYDRWMGAQRQDRVLHLRPGWLCPACAPVVLPATSHSHTADCDVARTKFVKVLENNKFESKGGRAALGEEEGSGRFPCSLTDPLRWGAVISQLLAGLSHQSVEAACQVSDGRPHRGRPRRHQNERGRF